MGDMSEYKGLITAGTLLACFTILSMAIPASLYTAEEGRILAPPDYFDIGDLYYFTQTSNLLANLTGGTYVYWGTLYQYYMKDVNIGGWDIEWYYRYPNSTSDYEMRLLHIHSEWIWFPADHWMDWTNSQGVDRGDTLTYDELNADLAGTNQARYRVYCDHTTYYTYIGFNDTAYSDLEDAWDFGGVTAFFGVQFDDENTGFNAMNLIASILFFQMPEIHIAINLLIAIPIWIAIGYISLILILRAIDALPFT